jgi:hypothetical protein
MIGAAVVVDAILGCPLRREFFVVMLVPESR